MPQYPVGYMVHFMMVKAFQAFEPLLENGHGIETPQLEIAMVHHLMTLLDKYVQSREKPVMRHFSDVARDYSVVMRLKCGCGAEKFAGRRTVRPPGSPVPRLLGPAVDHVRPAPLPRHVPDLSGAEIALGRRAAGGSIPHL